MGGKNNIIIRTIYSIVIVSIILSGCSSIQNENQISASLGSDIYSNDDASVILLDYHTLQNIICMVDDGILISENDGSSMKYTFIHSNGGKEPVGEIDNYIIGMKQSVLDYPYVFFYVGERTNETNDETNVLVQLNLDTHEQTEYTYVDDSLLGIPTYKFGNSIVTIKNVVTGNIIETYIESFDIDTKTRKIYMKFEYDSNRKEGEAVYGLCSDGENLYVLHDICDAAEGISSYIDVLNMNYEVCKSVHISKEIHDYALTSLVSDMQVVGEFVYIYNASNNGFLGRINGDSLVEIYKSNDFCISSDVSGEWPLFFIRRSNTILQLNENGELSPIKLDVKNGYCIMAVYSYYDTCFLLLYRDDCPYIGYFVKKNSL